MCLQDVESENAALRSEATVLRSRVQTLKQTLQDVQTAHHEAAQVTT